jgi:hypothetical protein
LVSFFPVFHAGLSVRLIWHPARFAGPVPVAARHRWPLLIELQLIDVIGSRMFWIQFMFIASLI